jgi:hypothetical protein
MRDVQKIDILQKRRREAAAVKTMAVLLGE